MAKKMKMPVESPAASTAVSRPEKSESKEYEARERKYRAESALSDIERAEAHRKNSKLMKDVKQLARDKVKCLQKI